ncbi:uncharacterized protein K02A2.6-like [Ornithodoros turicata]|uniref:uncharacterized protein K02A2.6-like n=1 Tax=Ornithodoros turicata TaxID=34597 RepID=UPI00313A2EEB
MDKDIELACRSCGACSASADHQVPVPLHQWEVPTQPWYRIHADFAYFDEKSYLVVVDAYSKWPELKLMTSTKSAATMEALSDIFAAHGLPVQLVTDNGSQFTSSVFTGFLNRLGIKHILTPPYLPKCNGQSENIVRSFKQFLRRQKGGRNQATGVNHFLLKYRVTPHATTEQPPCELLNKRHFRTELDLLRPNHPNTSTTARDRKKRNYDSHTRNRRFADRDEVWVKEKTRRNHWLRGTVIRSLGGPTYLVTTEDNKEHRVHADDLKIRLPDLLDFGISPDGELPGYSAVGGDADSEDDPQTRRYLVKDRRPPQRFDST